MDYNEYNSEGVPCPCINCNMKDYCTSWEAMFCCDLCQAHNEYPDCDGCDKYDI